MNPAGPTPAAVSHSLLTMDLDTFLALATRLEREAEQIYRTSAAALDALDAVKHREAVVFFEEMAGFAQRHRQSMEARRALRQNTPVADNTPLKETPEAPVLDAGSKINLEDAMHIALQAEQRGVDFYAGVAAAVTDPQLAALAAEFAAEERGHVLALERFIGRKPY